MRAALAPARRTEHYLATLGDMEIYAENHRFEGAGSFYAWELLQRLIGRLRARYDGYELEGDVAPVRREVEAFMGELVALHVRPDTGLLRLLNGFVGGLESVIAPSPHAA